MVVFLIGRSAEEPWLFLAACDEYYHCCIKRDRDYTALPVAVDATCSGYRYSPDYAETQELQVLSMSCQEKPADAYATVAEHAKPNVPDNVKPYMNRGSTVKRVVMTIPYNAKPHSAEDTSGMLERTRL